MTPSTFVRVALPACVAILASACSSAGRSGLDTEVPELKVQSVRLVDPQTWYSESDFFSADSGVHFRVEVHSDLGVDTVPDVVVLELPVLAPDSHSVYGIAMEPDDIVKGIFTYSPGDSATAVNSQPGPGYLPYSEPALSPSGDFLAYLANDRNYHFWLVVVSWPPGELLIETPRVKTGCTEFWGNVMRWVSADSLELYMNLCTDDTWARASGSTDSMVFELDTVGIEILEALRPPQ